jgi:SAM-dependent methyltransferase
MSIERLTFNNDIMEYDSLEATIHVSRYQLARDFVANKKVLDIACGEGYGSYLIKQWGAKSVLGVDIDLVSVNNAKKNFGINGVDFKCSSVEDLVIEDKFDLIISLETIEHVTSPELYLSKLKSMLQDNGILIISCPNDHYYYEESTSNEFHLRKYSFEDFVKETENILGEAKEWLVGSQVFGYANFKLDSHRTNIARYKQNLNMLDLVDQVQVNSSLSFGNKNYSPSNLNCAYYVGIWTKISLESVVIRGSNFFPIRPIKVPIESVDELRIWADNLHIDNKKLSLLASEYWDNYKHHEWLLSQKETDIINLKNEIEEKEQLIHRLQNSFFYKLSRKISYLLREK